VGIRVRAEEKGRSEATVPFLAKSRAGERTEAHNISRLPLIAKAKARRKANLLEKAKGEANLLADFSRKEIVAWATNVGSHMNTCPLQHLLNSPRKRMLTDRRRRRRKRDLNPNPELELELLQFFFQRWSLLPTMPLLLLQVP
jgi:hypothetical protein